MTETTRSADLRRPSQELAAWLRDLRRASGASLEELARRTGYSRSAIGDACSGRRSVTLPVLEAIVAACDGDLDAWRAYWRFIRRLIDSGDEMAPVTTLLPPWADALGGSRTPRTGEPEPTETEQADGAAPPGRGAAREPGDAPGGSRPARAGRSGGRLAALAVAVVALLAVVGGAAWWYEAAHRPGPAIHVEQAFNKKGVPTYKDPTGISDPGMKIPFGQLVNVSCKLLDPSIDSVKPDGYWYKIASAPWNDEYYAPANTFLNGDPQDGPYLHNTDYDVPDC